MDPQSDISWEKIAEILGGILVSIFGWLGSMAWLDVRRLNRNAVMKEELRKQFEDMRAENRRLHNERMIMTRQQHAENTARFDRVEGKIDENERINREARNLTVSNIHDLVMRIEEVNIQSIQRDADKQDKS